MYGKKIYYINHAATNVGHTLPRRRLTDYNVSGYYVRAFCGACTSFNFNDRLAIDSCTVRKTLNDCNMCSQPTIIISNLCVRLRKNARCPAQLTKYSVDLLAGIRKTRIIIVISIHNLRISSSWSFRITFYI